jgi:hypothetical protein
MGVHRFCKFGWEAAWLFTPVVNDLKSGSYIILVKPDCSQASWEPPSPSSTYAGAAILADAVLSRVEASDLHQKCVRTEK